MRNLYILRGVSNSGKSTLAKTLEQLPDSVAVAADDWFTDEEGNYNWSPKYLGDAHGWCKAIAEECMNACVSNVIVHNTTTTEKEIAPYIALAEEYGYRVTSLVVENRHRGVNNHNVPDEVRYKQASNIRNNLQLL